MIRRIWLSLLGYREVPAPVVEQPKINNAWTEYKWQLKRAHMLRRIEEKHGIQAVIDHIK